MILFRQAAALTKHLANLRSNGSSIGFVPTMGALHEGHLSLIFNCKEHTDIAVSSIFVNPTQFNDKKDFEKYPVTISDDIHKLEKTGCDILFLPTVEEIYPNGTDNSTNYDLGNLEHVYEGQYRPGHFQGVGQVMERLLKIVEPAKLFLGQKDFQQCKVIKRLIDLLQIPTQLVVANTTREQSGLAMSSRNMRLTDIEKENAAAIYKSLLFIKENYRNTSFEELLRESENFLLENGFSIIDYVSIADKDTLQPVQFYDAKRKHVALIAAFIGGVRLIDNMLLEEEV